MELTVRGISKEFGDIQALKKVNFTAVSGSPLGLLGRNGAGKTTAIRVIMGIFPPSEGEVLLDGSPIRQNDVKIGYLPEERGLYRKNKIGEQMEYFAKLRGLSAVAAKKRVDYWLERFELENYRNKKVEVLSKGNAQRVQLAIALINEPDIIILDEPFSGLDPVNSLQLKNVIREHASSDKVVIFSSHQMAEVEDFCDEIVIVNKGNVALSGHLSDIRKGYPHDRIRLETTAGYDEIVKITKEFGSACADKNSTVITLHDETQAKALLSRLVENGVNLSKFEIIEPTLEEIFVKTSIDSGDRVENSDEKGVDA